MKVRRAYELIGHEGTFKLPNGRVTYEAVMYDDARARSDRPRLARLDVSGGRLRQVNRWVEWDDPILVLVDFDDRDGED